MSVSAAERRTTSRWSSKYVSVRTSPGSPSHTIAARVRALVFRWRSRQLSLTLSVAPPKNFACGRFHSSNFVHGLRKTRSCVFSRQNVSGSERDSSYIDLYAACDCTCALAENSDDGG